MAKMSAEWTVISVKPDGYYGKIDRPLTDQLNALERDGYCIYQVNPPTDPKSADVWWTVIAYKDIDV
jgi:hypothetical protein